MYSEGAASDTQKFRRHELIVLKEVVTLKVHEHTTRFSGGHEWTRNVDLGVPEEASLT